MKNITLFFPILFLFGQSVSADCTQATRVTGTTLGDTLVGSTFCTNDSQEEHLSGGALWDYKKGDGDPIDPREQVGTWSVANDIVSYQYGSNGPYTFELHANGGNSYTFCGINNSNTIDATRIANTNVGC